MIYASDQHRAQIKMRLADKRIVLLLILIGHLAQSAPEPHEILLFGQRLVQDPKGDLALQEARSGDPTWAQKELYLDSRCFLDLVNDLGGHLPTGEVVNYLLKMKCDLKPLIRMFANLLNDLGYPSSDLKRIDFTNILTSDNGVDQSDQSKEIWREYSTFYRAVDHYVHEAMILVGQKEFCTYTTISRYGRLIRLTEGSKLLRLLNDMVIADYHSDCLLATIKKLPEVPYVVKDVVKMYIDGVEDTRKPDLNDPAILEMGNKGFDIDAAIRREGPIDQVASLMLTIPSNSQGGSSKELFRSKCHELLMELEKQWQPMEMMNQMLASESNSILQLNNLILRSIIPQKYAQICSQLVLKA